jgi:GNAT superfamily N-acetyltransferase
VVRAAGPADLPAILDLVALAMGEERTDRDDRFYSWKHLDNPFGPSPAWVACDDETVVGFRTFLRWDFLLDGAVTRAARAVDTATHPDYQGRGIFTELTLAGLEDLTAEGVQLIFNTPNDKSRPGYLKMGWTQVGRLPAWVHVTKPWSALRLLRSRVAAEKWSLPTERAAAADLVLADDRGLEALLASQPPVTGCTTRRTPAYLRWRYSFEPLAYRAVTGPSGAADGVVVFRLRRRGRCVEAAVDEILVPGAEPAAVRRLLRTAVRQAGADYALVLSPARPSRSWLRLSGQGPILTTRPLDGTAPLALDAWHLSLGDVELF